MRFIVVSDRPLSMTGQAFIHSVVDGVPISRPFRAEARVMDAEEAGKVLDACNDHFFGYRLEAA